MMRPLPFLVLAAATALAFPNEPRGFGEARFGMSQAAVKKIFPGMKPAGSGPAAGLPMAFFDLRDQSVHGLGPCALQLRFASDQLYEITFDCGRDDKVIAVLREQYGPPVQETPNGTFWIGQQGGITLNPRAKTFAFVDMALNRKVNAALLATAIKNQAEGGSPPP
jgi:hypothetical protein